MTSAYTLSSSARHPLRYHLHRGRHSCRLTSRTQVTSPACRCPAQLQVLSTSAAQAICQPRSPACQTSHPVSAVTGPTRGRERAQVIGRSRRLPLQRLCTPAVPLRAVMYPSSRPRRPLPHDQLANWHQRIWNVCYSSSHSAWTLRWTAVRHCQVITHDVLSLRIGFLYVWVM
ncbi:hypothetical protein EXIGLDRAFT_352812 [Exidia glandulosa HHB12029]|uniref:Uncharacterized protein n=1 Tax=Exidia glandulosa HHB12029 TaxID=1314781 RepID=A0A165LC93_EXIGL|nr:hypothetical protein EXIGLDRAFT_352812 [Exidia glandulosa HHB12029]